MSDRRYTHTHKYTYIYTMYRSSFTKTEEGQMVYKKTKKDQTAVIIFVNITFAVVSCGE